MRLKLNFWKELVFILLVAAICTSISLFFFPPVSHSTSQREEFEIYARRLEIEHNTPVGYMRALFDRESSWNSKARGAHGEIGLGQIKPDTLLKMCPSCGYRDDLIVYGSSGLVVRSLQSAIGATQDGVFGQETFDRLRSFQYEHNLEADGIVGPRTWKAVFNGDMPNGSIEAELLDPYKNMKWSAKYVDWLKDKLQTEDYTLILVAYNSGNAGQSVKYVLKHREALKKYR